ncbi:ABC transporter permease [Clostridium oryzae]|uniref:FtsX-like permease family protein n=1 Tax=Clostridium oryzae TaxID=1450648 RepID=A0A1V4ISZ7_9CLOT|nr:FtsX-like permease family protein [Clostridium oryzae]OPJ62925.1 FtsX-like permease family protein [Clostridium oryzae]
MNVFGKYILKSIIEKKGRMLLIVLSILLSSALLLASAGSVNTMIKMFTSQAKAAYENFNIAIHADSNSSSSIFKASDLNMKNINESFNGIRLGGYFNEYTNKNFNLIGTDLTNFRKFKSIKLINKKLLYPFIGRKLILSKMASQKLHLKVGGTVKLSILGNNYAYKVCAIASNNGLFLSDTQENNSFIIIVPRESLTPILKTDSKDCNFVYTQVKNTNLSKWINNFNVTYKNTFIAKPLIDQKSLEASTNDIKVPLIFMLCIVLIMSIFIIYSSFKLVVIERLPTIGTFLSQGCSFFQIVRMLIAESLLYGILGGILGDILGTFIITIIEDISNPLKAYGIKADFHLSLFYYAFALGFAIILSLISSIIPILSIRKMSIKDIILNKVNLQYKSTAKSLIAGIICIAFSVIAHMAGPYIQHPRPYALSLFAFFTAMIGIMLFLPKFLDLILYPVVNILRRFNAISMLSINNIRTSNLLINNIKLITISIIAVMLILCSKSSLGDILTSYYSKNNYDIQVSVNSNSDDPGNLKTVYKVIKNCPYVSQINETASINATLDNDTSKDIELKAIDPKHFAHFDKYVTFYNKEKSIKDLSTHINNIILSSKIATRYHIKKGSMIKLAVNDKIEKFKVLSFADVGINNMGNINFISMKSANKHFYINYADNYEITTTTSVSKVKKYLVKLLKGTGTDITTKREDIKNESKKDSQMLMILSLFSCITMLIGSFGILSNLSISFIQRKKEMAILSSIGLANGSSYILLFTENLIQGLLAIVVSLLASIGIVELLKDIFRYLVINLNIQYSFSALGSITKLTIILMIITTLPAVFKNKKLQVIKELKYE